MPHPILSNEQLAALKHMNRRGWQTQDDRHHLAAQRRQGRAWPRRSTASAPRPKRRSTTATRSSCSPTARSAPTACRSARCWRPAPCIITWCASRSGPASASSSKPARPAKCITTACWSATAPTRSIRTWRSSRCGKPAATGCSTPARKASDEQTKSGEGDQHPAIEAGRRRRSLRPRHRRPTTTW